MGLVTQILSKIDRIPLWVSPPVIFIGAVFSDQQVVSSLKSNTTTFESISSGVAFIGVALLTVQIARWLLCRAQKQEKALSKGAKIGRGVVAFLISSALLGVAAAPARATRLLIDPAEKSQYNASVTQARADSELAARQRSEAEAKRVADAKVKADQIASDKAMKQKVAADKVAAAAADKAAADKAAAAAADKAIAASKKYAGLSAVGIQHLRLVIGNIDDFVGRADANFSSATANDCWTLGRNYDVFLRGLQSLMPEFDPILSSALDDFWYGTRDCKKAIDKGDWGLLASSIRNFESASGGFYQLVNASK